MLISMHLSCIHLHHYEVDEQTQGITCVTREVKKKTNERDRTRHEVEQAPAFASAKGRDYQLYEPSLDVRKCTYGNAQANVRVTTFLSPTRIITLGPLRNETRHLYFALRDNRMVRHYD